MNVQVFGAPFSTNSKHVAKNQTEKTPTRRTLKQRKLKQKRKEKSSGLSPLPCILSLPPATSKKVRRQVQHPRLSSSPVPPHIRLDRHHPRRGRCQRIPAAGAQRRSRHPANVRTRKRRIHPTCRSGCPGRSEILYQLIPKKICPISSPPIGLSFFEISFSYSQFSLQPQLF